MSDDVDPVIKFEPTNKAKVDVKPGQSGLDAILATNTDDFLVWEDTYLPSRGLWYGDKIPDGRVQVRPMGMEADKIMSTQRLVQTGEALYKMIGKCVKLPDGFDPLELLVGDSTFLLYYIRAITYGNMYDYSLECSDTECKHVSVNSYDMNDLAYSIKFGKKELGPEPFKVVLPEMSKALGQEVWVGVRFLRGADSLRQLQYIKTKNKAKNRISPIRKKLDDNAIQADESLERNIHLLIVELGVGKDKTDDEKKMMEFVKKLHSLDRSAITNFLADNSPGLDSQIKTSCAECGNEMSIDLPITQTFFRKPESHGSKRDK